MRTPGDGALSGGQRSFGKWLENGCRQMGNRNFWLFRVLDVWESGLTICPMSTVSVYGVNAVYGQVGKPFSHLSELFAES